MADKKNREASQLILAEETAAQKPTNTEKDPDPLAELPLDPGDTGSKKWDRQEFFIPVSGFVWLFPEEVTIVDHPALQRLGRILQLGQSHLVFRGATHRRLEHVIGALHVVQRMVAAVETNSGKFRGRNWAPPLSESESRFVRLGTLLHDVGHMAAGHTVEDELQLVSKHDGDERLDLMFGGLAWRDREGKTLGEVIDRLYARYLPKTVKAAGLTPSIVVRLLIRKPPERDPAQKESDILKESGEIRMQICRDMIGNTICADLLDYIHRDWYHVGKPRPFDDRLLQYMEVRRGEAKTDDESPLPTDRFVISLGKRPKIRTDAVSNILDLLEWRYSLAETVLFHRTKLAAAAMLDRALFELWGGNTGEEEIVNFLLPLSDEEMLSRCRQRAETLRDDANKAREAREQAKTAATILSALGTC